MLQNKKGRWILQEGDIRIGPDDMQIDDWKTISTYLETWFDVDKRFGTFTRRFADYVNFYAIYYPLTRRIKAVYFIHYEDGTVSDEVKVRDLMRSEKKLILSEMRREGLDELIQEMRKESFPGILFEWLKNGVKQMRSKFNIGRDVTNA